MRFLNTLACVCVIVCWYLGSALTQVPVQLPPTAVKTLLSLSTAARGTPPVAGQPAMLLLNATSLGTGE